MYSKEKTYAFKLKGNQNQINQHTQLQNKIYFFLIFMFDLTNYICAHINHTQLNYSLSLFFLSFRQKNHNVF